MGKKKDAATHGLSKKAKRKLEERAAELAAELERRAKADKKKAKKKGKKAKKYDGYEPSIADQHLAEALGVMTIEAEAPIVPEPTDAEVEQDYTDAQKAEIRAAVEASAAIEPKHAHLSHLDRIGELAAIAADETVKPKARAKAAAELAALRAEGARLLAEKDADLREKIKAKRAAREAEAKSAPAIATDALDGETEPEYQMRKLRESLAAGAVEKVTKKATEVIAQVVEEIETETGREFAVGVEAKTDDFAKPSESGPELEEGRNGYKIIQLGADGKPDARKIRQITRVTTFIGNIDDETTLKKWDKRMVVEGLAADAMRETTESGDAPFVVQINNVAHRRDVKIAKAIKADRKGKLGIGEVASITHAAEKEAKDALDKIVEEAAEIAGRNKKARAGTHLHSLAEISDAMGIDYVRAMHEEGVTVRNEETGEDVPVTETDVASIEAYAARMDRLGAKVIYSEAVVVNDAMGYAGRLDRIITAKLPELVIGGVVRAADQRARRYVTDIKSGRIDLGAGKISRQLAAYATGDIYDPETGERSRHSAARDVALVFHLPQGEGVCTVHAVDLKAGLSLLKLSAEVRRARNTGKKTIDTTVDIADPAPGGIVLDESEA